MAAKLIKIYFSFFTVSVKKGEVDTKLMKALLTGVNRAFPYAVLDPAELDKQMDVMHKKIWEQREKMGGINASRENNQAIAKQACGLPRTDAPQSPSARALPRPLSARTLSCRG